MIIRAEKITRHTLDNIDSLLEKRIDKKTSSILKDPTPPLWSTFDTVKISRSGRFRQPKVKTNRFKYSFVPTAIRKLNNDHNR